MPRTCRHCSKKAYSAAAEKLAANAFRGGSTRGLIPCKPSPACRDQFIRHFGARAFRRPLDTGEAKRYTALFATESRFSEIRPARGRGDAAIAQFSISP